MTKFERQKGKQREKQIWGHLKVATRSDLCREKIETSTNGTKCEQKQKGKEEAGLNGDRGCEKEIRCGQEDKGERIRGENQGVRIRGEDGRGDEDQGERIRGEHQG